MSRCPDFPTSFFSYLLLFGIGIITSCGTSYHYYTPPVHNTSFNQKGEILVSGIAGNTGTAFQGGYSMSDRLALSVNIFNGRQVNYHSSEREFAFHFTRIDSNDARFTLLAGYNFGENYELKGKSVFRDFRGRMQIPFMQFSFGTASTRPVMGKRTYGDISLAFRINYLIYRGYVATSQNGVAMEKQFNVNNFFYEPYITFMLGGGVLKWEWAMGFPFKKRYDFDENLTLFPFETHIGMIILLGRKYRKALADYFKEKNKW